MELPEIGESIQIGFYKKQKKEDQEESLFLISSSVRGYAIDPDAGMMVVIEQGFHFPATWIYHEAIGFLFPKGN